MFKSSKLFLCAIILLSTFLCIDVFAEQLSNKNAEKLIALTFDDGPSIPFTEQILDILANNNAKATFFVIGCNVKKHPEILRKVFAAGNEIANHSYTHPMLTKISDSAVESELLKANEIIYQNIHVYPVLFRPPYGAISKHVEALIKHLGFRKITWDYLVNDYDVDKTTSTIISEKIIKNARPGAIMVMHDGSAKREKTVQALPIILAALKKEGYKFVTVAELLKIAPYKNEAEKQF